MSNGTSTTMPPSVKEQDDGAQSTAHLDGNPSSFRNCVVTNGNTNISHQSQQSLQVNYKEQDLSMSLDESQNSFNSTSKTPSSYKYPVLAKYYEFGPWISRNRRAICKGCQVSTSSSQPDRLLKHLKKCIGVMHEDKLVVEELVKERIRNKMLRGERAKRTSANFDDESSEYMDDDRNPNNNPLALSESGKQVTYASNRGVKRDPERKAVLDDALTKFIVKNRIPLKSIHSSEFLSLVSLLDSDYRVPSKETITNILIPRELKLV